jgi:hypothetical protein
MPAEGYTGTLEISFFDTGVRIALDRGAVTAIDEWYSHNASGHFPREVFMQLLCGRRRCRELTDAFADSAAPYIDAVHRVALGGELDGRPSIAQASRDMRDATRARCQNRSKASRRLSCEVGSVNAPGVLGDVYHPGRIEPFSYSVQSLTVGLPVSP